MFITKKIVKENERIIILNDGKFEAILTPGKYRFYDFSKSLSFETHALNMPKISSVYMDSIASKYPKEISNQVVCALPKEGHVALVTLNSKIYDIINSGSKGYYWKDAGDIKVEYINVKEEIFVAEDKISLFKEHASLSSNIVQQVNIPEKNIGILYINRSFKQELQSGIYYVWVTGRTATVQIIDTRVLEKEVSGQEVLTKDKVTIRINAVCYYQVSDALKAVSELEDYEDYLHKQLQFALRMYTEPKTLDQMLESKTNLEIDVTKAVTEEMGKYGVSITKAAVKDIILPGEMRDILNKVIQAEKLAEANVIKRREETAATRSLLNTAKLMEDSPMLLRLKELESLEAILQKVDNLSIYGGVENLIGKLFQEVKK